MTDPQNVGPFRYGEFGIRNASGASVIHAGGYINVVNNTQHDFESNLRNVTGFVAINIGDVALLFSLDGGITPSLEIGTTPAGISVSVETGAYTNSAIRVANTGGSDEKVTCTFFGVYSP